MALGILVVEAAVTPVVPIPKAMAMMVIVTMAVIITLVVLMDGDGSSAGDPSCPMSSVLTLLPG